MFSTALVPSMIVSDQINIKKELAAYITGIILLSLLAQVSVRLPWTPVPITGQTFGVMLVALSWGRSRATIIITSYLFIGGLGLPVFASGTSGLSMGPTVGYLLGMVFASVLVGYLADVGCTKTFTKSLISSAIGSLIVFFFGLLVLSKFIPASQLLTAGLWPFIPGEMLKILLASSISWKMSEICRQETEESF